MRLAHLSFHIAAHGAGRDSQGAAYAHDREFSPVVQAADGAGGYAAELAGGFIQ